MSRVARLGAFIVVTLAVLAAGVFVIGSKEYLFRSTYQLKAQFDNVAGLAEGADVQVGGVHSGTVHRHRVATQAGREGHGHHGTRQVDARDYQAGLRGLDRNRGSVGQSVRGDFVWICRASRGEEWRDHPERTAAGDGGSVQEDERHSGQQPAGHSTTQLWRRRI